MMAPLTSLALLVAIKGAEACTVVQETDYAGGDYNGGDAASAEDCCAMCSADTKCVAGVFRSGHCYLKNKIVQTNACPECTAVMPGDSPTPTPPAPTPTPLPTPPPTPRPVGPWDTSGLVGAEYTPWRAPNSLWWHEYGDYRSDVVRELKLAKEVLGFTTVRMYLHSMLYTADASALKANIKDFLDICEAEGFKAGFVFFDDCWLHAGADLAKPCIPRKGMHNMCSMASPQDVERTDIDRFQSYVSDLVKTFREDKRVAWWEIFNEPNNNNEFSLNLRHAGFGWAKAQNPTQPVIACWDDHSDTEIVDHHQYFLPWNGANNGVFSNPAKGGIVTEAGARWYQHLDGDSGSPLTVVNWLTQLKKGGQAPFIPGVMIDWALMIGHDQTRWHWGDAEGLAEPPIPWHGHLYPDGTPVSFTEAAAIRRYTTGVDEFLFVETFLEDSPISAEKFLTLQPGQSFSSTGLSAKEGMFELTFWPESSLQSASTCLSGEGKDFMGTDVVYTTCEGSTDEEKDASCCSLCEANAECDFWVRSTTTNECWLKKDYTWSFARADRRGNFNVKACGFIGEAKTFSGTEVLTTTYEGGTDEEKDGSCCMQCRLNADCDFWERATDSNQCTLKKGFTGFQTCDTCRGNFKSHLWSGKLLFNVAGSYDVSIDAYNLKLSDSKTELASVSVLEGIPEGGIVMDSWNMLRVLVQGDRVQVWINPQFSDVTGGSVPPQDEQSMKAMPPRIDMHVNTPATGGDLKILAPNGNKANVRVDYVSALPPKLYGLAAESSQTFI